MFSLNKFLAKDHKNYYNSKEECEKKAKSYSVTNPRFTYNPKFDQKFFTAGDWNDLIKYGLLPLRFYYSETINTGINKSIEKINLNKSIKPIKLDKVSNNFYKNIDYESVNNTLTYLFEKFKKGIFVIIRDNKLAVFLPFSNAHYRNNWERQTYFSESEKNFLQTEKNLKSPEAIRILNDGIMKFYKEKYNGQQKIVFQRDRWVANNCFFRNQFPTYEGEKNTNVFHNMLINLLEERKIPDIEFFINERDFPLLKKDLTEPYEDLFDSDKINIEEKYQFKKFAPLFSRSKKETFADLLFPTEDDWMRISGKYYTDKCSDGYTPEVLENINLKWKSKKPVCIFRGAATGCGITSETNVRLKAADLAVDYPDILDIGIVDWNARMKKFKGQPIDVIKPNKFRFALKNKINQLEKSNYKYILNLDGHVSAFRLSSELGMMSVVLLVDSDYKMWYSDLLVPYKHYIPIKKDLSDLVSQVEWCKNNDSDCEKIAKNALKLYNESLGKKGVFDYLQKMFVSISLQKDYKNLLSLPKSLLTKKKKNVAVITIFRDNDEGSRAIQREKFIKIMPTLLGPYCNFTIFIIEQAQGELFNIGKLKNIGFEIATSLTKGKKKNQYDHFVFTDIDMIPDYDLMEYYVQKPIGILSLAAVGTRYTDPKKNYENKNTKGFVGGAISCTEETFIKVNGYPNNNYGWGGEDDALLIRMAKEGVPNSYPKKGSVIDIEETDNMKTLNLVEKLEVLKFKQEKEMLKYEKWYHDLNHYKENGLNSLRYSVISYEIIKEKNVHLPNKILQFKVDLMKPFDEKKNPNWFPQKFNNKNYIERKENVLKIKNKKVERIFV